MKLSAITSRATNKDYIDLYFIIKEVGLKSLLSATKDKFSDLDENLILKSLVYYEDIDKEAIRFKEKQVSFAEVKRFLKREIENYLKNYENKRNI